MQNRGKLLPSSVATNYCKGPLLPVVCESPKTRISDREVGILSHATNDELTQMARALENSGEYRILRRLVPRDVFGPRPDSEPIKIGVLLDVETTGLNAKTDEVIELGMVKFAYCPDGRVVRVIDCFGALNETATPIPAEITALTGITNDMVANKQIDAAAVSTFIADANIVIAHNANFDRKFAERHLPQFAHKHWGCSVTPRR